MIVDCPKCGARNSILDPPEPRRIYLCAKCKAKLVYVSRTRETSNPRRSMQQTTKSKENRVSTKAFKIVRRLFWMAPLLFAISPVLFLFSKNMAEVRPSELVVPLVVTLSFGILVLVLCWLIVAVIRKVLTRPQASLRMETWSFEKAAIVASIFLFLFLSYGDANARFGGEWFIPAVIWILLFLIGAFLVARHHGSPSNLTAFCVVLGVILVLWPMIGIISHETHLVGHAIKPTGTVGNSTISAVNSEVLPDIYYIVPDRYGSLSSLQANFNFDNSEFTNYLTSRGFYVAQNSKSNYPRTFASLASSLNMEYINYLTEELGENFGANYPMWQLIQDNKVWQFLKSKGYRFINLGDHWDGTMKNINADMNYNLFTMPGFSRLLFQKTLAYPFCVHLGITDDDRITQMKNVLYQFGKLAEIPDMEEPTFTFAHLCIPHDPFVFHSNGEYKTLSEEKQDSYGENYIDKLTFCNYKFKVLIDELLADSEVPPIIIIQADEGPFTISEPWLGEKATETGLRIKFGILNAYYLPGVDKDVLYPSITPVNSFRLVFDQYFGTDLGLLEDKHYAYDDGYPERFVYRFLDVTDKLK